MQKFKPGWPLAFTLTGLLASTLAASSAATVPDMQPAIEPCHALLTEQECDQFKIAQVQLESGPDRDRFLAAHQLLLQEREAACNCKRKEISMTLYPQRRQALLQH